LELLEQVDAVAVGQTHVDDHQIEVVPRQEFLGLRNGGCGRDVIPLVAQLLLEALADHQVVFQDDDLFDRHWRRHNTCGRYGRGKTFCPQGDARKTAGGCPQRVRAAPLHCGYGLDVYHLIQYFDSNEISSEVACGKY
jgi:hypothetical protein